MTLQKRIADLKKKKGQLEKALKRARDKATKSVVSWKNKEQAFRARVIKILDCIKDGGNTNTQEMQRITELNKKWIDAGSENVKVRDANFGEVKVIEEEFQKVEIQLASALATERAESDANDNIVHQVFEFRDNIITLLTGMNNFLTENVYDRLIGPDGNLRSQITLYSSDGLRKIIAMVNSISKIDPTLAIDALLQINAFFTRIRPDQSNLDEATQVLYELTQKILVEKTSFSVGPDLYRFLSLDLNEKNFPEIVEAQRLLKRSLRSEKTNSYIRLYQRDSRSSKWQSVSLTI